MFIQLPIFDATNQGFGIWIALKFSTFTFNNGKWPNGVALTKEQREICMQAVYAWEMKNLPETERSGYIDRGTKEEGEECDDDHHKNEPEFKPIRFV